MSLTIQGQAATFFELSKALQQWSAMQQPLQPAPQFHTSPVQPLSVRASLLEPVHDSFCLHRRFWLKVALLKSLL